MQESIYHGTPILGFPICADQFSNALNIETKGVGLSLTWEHLTVDAILTAIQELMDNAKWVYSPFVSSQAEVDIDVLSKSSSPDWILL